MLHSLIYPPRCPGCDEILYEKGRTARPLICPSCDGKILRVHQPVCMKCGKPLEVEEEEYCRDCERKQHEFDRGLAAFVYSDVMKRSMYAFKYNSRREYADFYARTFAKSWSHVVKMWGAEVLIPVPLHAARYRKRGYNQAEDFAKRLGIELELPVDTEVLVRIKNTRPQKELGDKDRQNNINNAFKISNNVLKYKKLVIVDDIYTTGTTIDECARALKSAGAEQVFFICACIGNGF